MAMNPLIPVPREALAQLLKSAGSTLTPEQFVAEQPEMNVYRKYPGRARAAAWSKSVLLVVVIFAGLIIPFSFDFENLLIFAGLATVTYFEARVHRGFQQGKPDAPKLGFTNQSCFAAGILIYGIYHAILPPQFSDLHDLGIDPGQIISMQGVARGFYVIIGVVGGVSQFALAWYYRSANAEG
jgi:hypothetical protein